MGQSVPCFLDHGISAAIFPLQVLSAVILSVADESNVAFTIQVNSSVQWFKGDWQHPNTYVQVRGTERGLGSGAMLEMEWCGAAGG